ncbi:hypothetical protein PspLS_07089 [Pyricularia sp. CBS 133598]|nr:hypothetical protein PspLS_07089 [Pyricularia sp. CBS 133598]
MLDAHAAWVVNHHRSADTPVPAVPPSPCWRTTARRSAETRPTPWLGLQRALGGYSSKTYCLHERRADRTSVTVFRALRHGLHCDTCDHLAPAPHKFLISGRERRLISERTEITAKIHTPAVLAPAGSKA